MEVSQVTPFLARWIQAEGAAAPLLLCGQTHTAWPDLLTQAKLATVCPVSLGTPCGSCPSCKQAAIGIHPDVIEVAPTEPSIRIEDVRTLLATLSKTALSSRRLVIIPRAERLIAQAANALLKQLEEQSDTSRFLLTTAFRRRILPTIASRCQIVRVASPAQKANPAQGATAYATLLSFRPSGKQEPLSDDALDTISDCVQQIMRQSEADFKAIYPTMMRLRDYYKVRAYKGNEKLAADILLATISQLRNTNR